jgi:putative MATE family efflux protein
MMKKAWHLMDPSITNIKTEKGTLSLRQLFFPFFIEQVLVNLMGTVNTLVLGHYSDESVAAVGAANQVLQLVYTFFAVVSGGASIVISHRLGEAREKEASDTAFAALAVSTFLSLSVSAVLVNFTVPMMKALNLTGSALGMAISYFRISICFSAVQGIVLAISAILRSYGRPGPAVAASVLMNALNAMLNWIVVFRPFETPLSGASGIAVSGVISRISALLMISIFLKNSGLRLGLRHKKLSALKSAANILKIGLPGGVSNLSYSFSQVVSTAILGTLGTLVLSTRIYVSSIVFYVYVTGMSLGMSVSILVGWLAGAGEYDKVCRLNRQTLRLAVLLNVSLSICLYLVCRPLMSLFTSRAEILQMAGKIFFIDIFVELGRGINHIEENTLRGAGDVFFPMAVSIASCWGISILFSYVLGIRMGLGLYGCWIAFMLDELFRGTLLSARFRSGKWKCSKV